LCQTSGFLEFCVYPGRRKIQREKFTRHCPHQILANRAKFYYLIIDIIEEGGKE